MLVAAIRCYLLVTTSCAVQGLSLTTLHKDILTALLQHLDTAQQAKLRLVCKQLADAVRLQTTEASTLQRVSSQLAQGLNSRFPELHSLTCKYPVSTHYLCSLTRLTHLCLGDSDCHSSHVFRCDLAPLESLPLLHSLHLQRVVLQPLAAEPACMLAALTQLRTLCLESCQTDQSPGPHDISALPRLRQLQVLMRNEAWLAQLGTRTNLQKVPAAPSVLLLSLGSSSKSR